MKKTMMLAIMLLSQLALATVPDGTYQGTGTWETRNAAGVIIATGVLESTWEQNGTIGTNLGVMKIGTTVVGTFQDSYGYELVSSSPDVYILKRLISGNYVAVGIFHKLGSAYLADFDQSGARAVESGNVVNNVLSRLGHLVNTDGSIIYYRVNLNKQ